MAHPSLGILQMTQKTKRRADEYVQEFFQLPSRAKAQALILSGEVLAGDQVIAKPGQLLKEGTSLRLRHPLDPYVARSAHKLIAAFEHFPIEVSEKKVLDIGASTGGFTQVCLERGAAHVIALDVGHNQLDYKIRIDPRVTVIEKHNARYLTLEQLPYTPELIVVDVSFISLTNILPAMAGLTRGVVEWVTLIKPQFEVGPSAIEKGGLVKDSTAIENAIQRVRKCGENLGVSWKGLLKSPITGQTGNQEYLAYWIHEV